MGRFLCELYIGKVCHYHGYRLRRLWGARSKKKKKSHIQKHHLHVEFPPPIGGPIHTAMTNTLITIPIYSGLFSSSTAYLIILKAPCRMPAAPRPATALPTINILEDVAAAHRIDPTNMKRNLQGLVKKKKAVQYIVKKGLGWKCKNLKI